ncbi:hypothetical protein GWI33_019799 [Rhynchophorus ferrugineus]|uniref:Uncharacterized protein n=1 Tax=Rhynchophorus ferrugineus TaxID=354439 RepID=A0A834M4X6_RHYFE|nr:hypothetical protein GWI33_019799 [Rhynchophorus ferrugineus]
MLQSYINTKNSLNEMLISKTNTEKKNKQTLFEDGAGRASRVVFEGRDPRKLEGDLPAFLLGNFATDAAPAPISPFDGRFRKITDERRDPARADKENGVGRLLGDLNNECCTFRP